MSKVKTLLIALVIVLFHGCRPDESPAFSKDKLIGVWKFKGVKIKYDNSIEADVYASLPPCKQDDMLDFLGDKFYEQTEGPTKCDQSDPQIVNKGTWKLKGSTLTMDDGIQVFTVEVLELSEVILRFNMTNDFGLGGQGSVVTFTYWSQYLKNP